MLHRFHTVAIPSSLNRADVLTGNILGHDSILFSQGEQCLNRPLVCMVGFGLAMTEQELWDYRASEMPELTVRVALDFNDHLLDARNALVSSLLGYLLRQVTFGFASHLAGPALCFGLSILGLFLGLLGAGLSTFLSLLSTFRLLLCCASNVGRGLVGLDLYEHVA